MSDISVTPTEAALTEGVLTRRIAAWIIDFVLIGAVVLVAWLGLLTFGALTLGLGLPLLGVVPVIPFAYHAAFVTGAWSATPGQAMLDLVVRRDADLGKPSLLQVLVFTGGLWLTLSTGFLLLLIAPFTPHKRALHDIVSGLVIVRKHALTPPPASVNMADGTGYR